MKAITKNLENEIRENQIYVVPLEATMWLRPSHNATIDHLQCRFPVNHHPQASRLAYHHKTCISTICHVSMSHEKSLWRQWVQLLSPHFLCKFGKIKLCRSCMYLMLSLPISLLTQKLLSLPRHSFSLQTLSLSPISLY